MFTTNHFIWLGAIALLIALALIVLKKLKISDRAVGKAVMITLIILKIFHMSLSMKESEFGGYILNQTQLSFHLCSIMIYTVIFTNMINNKKVVDTLKSFMVPCLFIGAAMALLIPTEGADPTVPRVWQYMLIHGVLVFYGIYLAAVERVDLSFRAYFNNLKLLLGVTLIAFLMNSVLEQYETNFLFLRVPPMDNLPLLNLDNGWYVYFLTLAAIACVLVLLVQLPFMALNARRKKRELSQ
ncbi:MAG: YwaF family protein [Clostridia bacterium]|nr:YwaF family protein [Clostridia bacterium]